MTGNEVLQQIADKLKQQVDEKKFIDVGLKDISVSQHKINGAFALLKKEGYQIHYLRFTQVGTEKTSIHKVLVGPGITQKDTFDNRGNIVPVEL